MKKVIDDGVYCYQCESFLNRDQLMDADCYCDTLSWKNAKVVIEVEEDEVSN